MSLTITDKRGANKPRTIQSDNADKTPPPWWQVFIAIERERFSQLAKWGDQRGKRADGTSATLFAGWRDEYQRQNDAREEAGKPGIWSKILLEEVFEAMSETDPILLEDELVQVAAVAVAWLEDLQQRRQTDAA